jgi:RHS repeat-associated protein
MDENAKRTASADYGARTTAPSLPTSSATVLVTGRSCDGDGRPSQMIDPKGIVTQTSCDYAVKTTQTIEDFGTGKLNRMTDITYTLDNQIATLTAVNSTTGDQTTTYTYGTNLSSSSVASNDLLASVTYPDSVSGSDVVSYAYNRLGQQRTITDQRGTVRTIYYDALGRQTNDCVTTVGGGTDSAVLQIATAYEVRGMPSLITSTDSATQGSGTVLNQIALTYNTFSQLSQEQQEHSGNVSGSSLSVQYNYSTGASVSNQIRPTTLIYPNSRVITSSYGTSGGMNDYLSRVDTIQDTTSGTNNLSSYAYLGSSMVVRITYPQPSVWLDLWGGTSGTFDGLDLFSRIVDQRWQNNVTGTPTDIDRYQYGYDQNSNRLYKANVVGTAAVGGLDEAYAYDNLNRLTQMQRGNLSGGVITGTPTRQMDYTLDPTGNWAAYLTKTNGTTDLNQTRTANKVNEITAIGGTPAWATPPVYDPAGNMASFPQPASPSSNFIATYDAWNRMTSINTSSGSIATYQYDGRGRRIVKNTTAISETRHFYYTNDWQDIEERTGTSTTMDKQYVWGARFVDELVCRDDATPQRLYAMQDANFNLTSIANASGGVVERYRFDPYGSRTIMNASWGTISASVYDWVVGHQGLMHDEEDGLVYDRARYLSPMLGRFMSRDPIGYVGGLNIYEYIGGDPIDDTDSLGLKKTIGKGRDHGRNGHFGDPNKKRDCSKTCPAGQEKTVVILGDVSSHGSGLYVGGWISEQEWKKRYQEYLAQAGGNAVGYPDGVSMAQMQDIVQDPCTKNIVFIGHSSQDQGAAPLPGIWINPDDFLQPSDVQQWRNNCKGPDNVMLRSCNQGMGTNRKDWGDAWGTPQDHLRVPDYYERWWYLSGPPAGAAAP